MSKEIDNLIYNLDNNCIIDEEKCYNCEEYDQEYYKCEITKRIFCCNCYLQCTICKKVLSYEYFKDCIVCEDILYILCLESYDEIIQKQFEEEYKKDESLFSERICEICYKENKIKSVYCHTFRCATKENAKKYYNID